MSSIPFPQPTPRLNAAQAGQLLSSLEDDANDPYQVVCTRFEDHKKGLQILSMNQFREKFPEHTIELDDESGPPNRPPTHWFFKTSGYRQTRIRIGNEHRKYERNGPVAIIRADVQAHLEFADKLDSFYKNNGHLNDNFK